MIILKATTETLQVVTTTAAAIDYSISYADITTTTFVPSSNEGKITSATTSSVLAAPASSTQRQVKLIVISNRDTSANTITVQKLISSTSYALTPTIALNAGESAQYIDSKGWILYSSNGTVRADMTAGGANTQVQFNNNGALGGDPNFTYDPSTETFSVAAANATIDLGSSGMGTPTTPTNTVVSLFGRSIANRIMLAQIGPSGLDSALQPFLARNKIGYWNPQGASTTAPGVFGITALTTLGTATARTVTTTNLATRMRRIGYPSSTTAGTFAGVRLPVLQFTCGSGTSDGSGFMLVERWVESDPAVVSGRRAFHGMSNVTTATPSNVEPNTLTYCVGVCQLSTDATQWYWYAAGSSTQTAVAAGTTIGAPAGNSTTAWELSIFAPAGVANTFYVQLLNISTGVSVTKTFSGGAAVVPQSTTLLGWWGWATNNATAAAVGMDLCSLYIETDT